MGFGYGGFECRHTPLMSLAMAALSRHTPRFFICGIIFPYVQVNEIMLLKILTYMFLSGKRGAR
jgi:hypothetical protein